MTILWVEDIFHFRHVSLLKDNFFGARCKFHASYRWSNCVLATRLRGACFSIFLVLSILNYLLVAAQAWDRTDLQCSCRSKHLCDRGSVHLWHAVANGTFKCNYNFGSYYFNGVHLELYSKRVYWNRQSRPETLQTHWPLFWGHTDHHQNVQYQSPPSFAWEQLQNSRKWRTKGNHRFAVHEAPTGPQQSASHVHLSACSSKHSNTQVSN